MSVNDSVLDFRQSYKIDSITDSPYNFQASAHHGASLTDPTLSSWLPPLGSADSDLLPDLPTLIARSRDMARNNGLAAGVMQTYRDNIVGQTLRLSAQPNWRVLGRDLDWANQWQRQVEAQFMTWAESVECDAARTMNLIGLTLQALGAAMLNGDAVCLPLYRSRAGDAWKTKLMLIESDRLSTPYGLSSRRNVRGGIEIDRYGAPVAYYIRKTHPGDQLYAWLDPAPAQWERIPAFTIFGRRRVIHLHDKERTGQSRGKPVFSAVMREFNMLGKYETTELQAAVVNSLIAAFLESDLDQDSAAALFSSGEDNNPASYWNQAMGEYRASLKGGAVIPLPAGAKLSSFDPNRPNNAFDSFVHAVIQHMAAGLNLPYELLAKDFSRTNYSSARAALLEAWRYFNGRRRWLSDYWLNPIYELWLEEAVNAGRVEAPDFYQNRQAYTRARWIFAGRGWVDPVKEAQAAKIRMESGLSTLESECAEQGLDWEDVLNQLARERALRNELGLPDPSSDPSLP